MSGTSCTRRAFIGGAVGLVATAPKVLKGFENVGIKEEEKLFPVRERKPNPFMRNGMPIVVVVRGNDYAAMLAKGMEALGGFGVLATDKQVIVKPNFILNTKSQYPVTTDPQSVLTTVDMLRAEGFGDIMVADSRNTEDDRPGGMFKFGGVNERADADGFKTNALRDDEVVKVRDDRWNIMPYAGVYKKIYTAGLVISMPTLKQHLMTGFTCALKNNMGCVDEWSCMKMHLWGKENEEEAAKLGKEGVVRHLSLAIPEIASAVNPDLTIIDARKVLGGSHLPGPQGTVCDANCLIISADPLAADVVAEEIFREVWPSLDIKYMPEAFELAAGFGVGIPAADGIYIQEISV